MKKHHAFSILLLLAFSACYRGQHFSYPGYDSMAYETVPSGDRYTELDENAFLKVSDAPVSTFSTDADGASYANTRRFIMRDKVLPPKGVIRTEEMLNYFDLNYPFTNSVHPISLNGEVSECPWNTDHKLLRIGIKGQPLDEKAIPNSNYVFLIDVSGSMSSEDKLEMLKNGFELFVDQMREDDRVAIVTYAGADKLVLESTSGREKEKIRKAIKRLGSGGSTAGAAGITTAYEIAEANFIPQGNNRIILGTDGDFNVGMSNQDELISLIEKKRETGVYLTVLGVGRGNLNEAALEQIANHGNGTYEYIDHIEQLRKVFIYDAQKFHTVAKDVKVQVAFNPESVSAYRLIGYENRALNNEDFADDKKDAAEIGANQNITALYEVVPAANNQSASSPTFTVDFRFKKPVTDISIPMSLEVYDRGYSFDKASDFMKFSAAVASFSMLISDSEYKGGSNYEDVLAWLKDIRLDDSHNFKAELTSLVEAAENLRVE